MNKEQVIALIGEERWEDFQKFMAGQTVGFDKGIIDYYECDVNRFVPQEKSDAVYTTDETEAKN